MPTIEQSRSSKLDLRNYVPAEVNSANPNVPNSNVFTQESIRRDVFLRCPVPPIGNTNPDNLRQYYLNGQIPQYRIFVNS